jgi:hypothetical protein
MNIHEQVFVWTCVFLFHFIVLKGGVAEAYGNSMFNILRNCQTFFQSDCMILD